MRIDLEWHVGHSPDAETEPVRRVPAQVPGAVQLDWARAEGWPEYWYADNYKAYSWMEDVFWSYTATIDRQQVEVGKRIYLVCGGIDYRFEVKLDGVLLHSQEGMFTAFELDLTDVPAGTHQLEVLVYPVPKRPGATGKAQADQSVKPPVSYGWDWHPRLIPCGIWEETYLETRLECHLIGAEVSYELDEELTCAFVCMNAQVRLLAQGMESVPRQGLKLRWTLTDRLGNVVLAREAAVESGANGLVKLDGTLDSPELWWPNGDGEPVLYTSRVELLGGQHGPLGEVRKAILLDSREASGF